jgi:hypothetical protein
MTLMGTKTYKASCHCDAVRFRFTCEEITSGRRCNCSICIRKGWSCPRTASVPPDYTGPARPGDYRINLGCVHDVDVLALDIEVINGKAF